MSKQLSTLTERVQVRVDAARLVVDRRAVRAAAPVAIDSLGQDEIRESQSLRRVFRAMGVSYRRYRSQTGSKVVPGLRDAAYTFRGDPSLTSLVAVAAFLDNLDLLS
jgi:hypothetical protein